MQNPQSEFKKQKGKTVMGISLSILSLGSIFLDKNLFVCNSNFASQRAPSLPNERIQIPVQAFLIRDGERNILFDTGSNINATGENGRWPLEFQNQVQYVCTPDETILAQLKRFGLTPDDIDCVVLSHMHNDHAGSLELFNNAQIYVHREELHACLEAYAIYDPMSSYIWKDIDTWLKKQWNWNFVEDGEPDFELIPGVRIINLGSGHTRGDLALAVSLEHYGNVILAGDAIYCEENITPRMRQPGVIYDTIGWKRSAARLVRLAHENNAQLWFGHDMEQFRSLVKTEVYY